MASNHDVTQEVPPMSDIRTAADIKHRNVQFIWGERIPVGMIATIAGKPDQGKGLTGAMIAADVSRAKGMAEQAAIDGIIPKKGGRVLYSPNEDMHEVMTAPRLEVAGANMRNVLVWDFVLPTQLQELEEVVLHGTPGNPGAIDLVIMDPWNSHLEGVSKFSDKLRTVVLNPLKALCDRTGVTIIVIDHVNKRVPKNADPLSVISGSSSGLAAASRAAFLFGTDPDNPDQRILAPVKFNVGFRPAAFAFEIDTDDTDHVNNVPMLIAVGETIVDPIRLVGDKPKSEDDEPKVGRPNDKRKAACEWLTRYLAQHGKTRAGLVQEDAKQMGITSKTLRNARVDMDIVLDPPGGGKNCTWDLPDDAKIAMGLMPDPNEQPATDTAQTSSETSQDVAGDDADALTITDADLASLLGGDA